MGTLDLVNVICFSVFVDHKMDGFTDFPGEFLKEWTGYIYEPSGSVIRISPTEKGRTERILLMAVLQNKIVFLESSKNPMSSSLGKNGFFRDLCYSHGNPFIRKDIEDYDSPIKNFHHFPHCYSVLWNKIP